MEWGSTDIGKVCHATHTRDPGRKPEKQFRYIDISGIDRDRKEIVSVSTLFGNEAPIRARKVVQTDDVLVSTVRPNLNAVALVPEQLDGQIASTGFCVLRANQKALDARYLFYYTQHPEFVSQLMAHIRGANYPAVTDSTVKAATLPLPHRSEQRRIVEILDQADALRKQRVEADKLSARILPALFYQMFGDPATNPKGFASTPIGKAFDFIGGGTPSKRNPMYWNGSIPWVSPKDMGEPIIRDTIDHITEAAIAESSTTIIPSSAIILVVRSGVLAHTAPIAMLAREMALNQDMKALVPKSSNIEPLYFLGWGLVAQQIILSCVKMGGTVHSIDMSKLKSTMLMVPDIAAQKSFGIMLQDHLTQRESRKGRVKRLDKLFSTLLHRAFSGDLTSKWRETHMKELLQEMAQQAKELNIHQGK